MIAAFRVLKQMVRRPAIALALGRASNACPTIDMTCAASVPKRTVNLVSVWFPFELFLETGGVPPRIRG